MNSLKEDVTKLKSIIEYAAMIGCSRQWVYELIKRKEIQTVEIGGKTFIKLN